MIINSSPSLFRRGSPEGRGEGLNIGSRLSKEDTVIKSQEKKIKIFNWQDKDLNDSDQKLVWKIKLRKLCELIF